MAAHQLIGPLPLVSLDAGCTITVEAIDPDSGANVSGVVVSQVAIFAVTDSTEAVTIEPADNYFTFTADEL